MLKKTTLALATAATLGIAALAPSTASAKTSFHLGFYGGGPAFAFGVHSPYYGGYYAPRRYRKRCYRRWRKVHTYYGWRWKKVRICRRYY